MIYDRETGRWFFNSYHMKHYKDLLEWRKKYLETHPPLTADEVRERERIFQENCDKANLLSDKND